MATEPRTTGLTYADLREFPEDNLRRELIDGELIVTAAPALRHQRAVVALVGAFLEHERRHGGKVFPAPTDVYLSDINVVEPDVVFVTHQHASKLEKPFVRGAPDIVVEISSPYRLGPDGYGTLQMLSSSESITSSLLPGFELPVAEILEED